jgi:hypothetical protein
MRLRHSRLQKVVLGCALGAIFTVGGLSPTANAAKLTPRQQAFREIYKELVEINSVGDTVKSAEAMAARRRGSGIPAADIRVISSGPRKGNMVARLRGSGARRPILLIAPYGRGRGQARGLGFRSTMASIFVANLIEYAKAGRPSA